MIKPTKITPMFNHILTTADRVDIYQKVNGIILPNSKIKGGFSEFQRVLAVGSMVHNINVGDLICIDPSAYGRPVHKDKINSVSALGDDVVEMEYIPPTMDVGGKECLYIADRDVAYIVNEFEEVSEDDGGLVKPDIIVSN